MSEFDSNLGKAAPVTLGDVKRLRTLVNAGAGQAARDLILMALESGDPAILRDAVFELCTSQAAPLYVRWSIALIDRYRTLRPDMHRYDSDLIRILAALCTQLGQWKPAAAAFRELNKRSPSFNLMGIFELARALYLDGEFAEASRLITLALEIYKQTRIRARAVAAGRMTICGPYGHPGAAARAIGEMCFQIDTLYRAQALGWIDDPDAAFIIDEKSICNESLLGYWRRKLPVMDLGTIPSRTDVYFLNDFANHLWCMAVPGLGGVYRDVGWALLNEVWQDKGLPPSLALDEAHRQRGRKTLAEIGISQDDWFICVHVRSNGFYGGAGGGGDAHNSFRSASIDDYLPMFSTISARGGWVIRLGDPSMPPLPAMERVFDYAVSPWKSDWMDVFLCAAARLVVGTHSGLHLMATVFGTPVVVTNYLPLTAFPVGPDDMVIHQKIFSQQSGRYLTIRESFRPPMVGHSHHFFFEDNNLTVVANTPDEITDVVLQMLDFLEGRPVYDEAEQDLWERYRDDANFSGHKFRYRIGRLFLRNIRDLLTGAVQAA